MPRIFISYRRDESAGYAGRIHERLGKIFGTDSVFMDVDDIVPGKDFVNAIDSHIASCDVMLVLIGKQWLTLKDAAGRRRIDDPKDLVRIEVSKGLSQKIHVVPLLINGASMPPEENLPDPIKALSRYQAIELSEERWEYDFGKLTDTVGGKSDKQKPRRLAAVALAALVFLFIVGAMLWSRRDAVGIRGRWIGEVQYEFGRNRLETFHFERSGSSLRGSASFLGVDRKITEGKIERDTLSFVTRTIEVQGTENREATHHYDGKVSSGEIRVVMQTVGGFSDHPPISFTLRRAQTQ